mgnify:FL=1
MGVSIGGIISVSNIWLSDKIYFPSSRFVDWLDLCEIGLWAEDLDLALEFVEIGRPVVVRAPLKFLVFRFSV